MAAPVPAVKAIEWISTVVDMMTSGSIDELALKRIERENQRVLDTARLDANMLQPSLMLSALIEVARGHYREAHGIFSSIQNPAWEVYSNHIRCLTRGGLWLEAASMISGTLARFPDTKEALMTSLSGALMIGDYWSAVDIEARLTDLHLIEKPMLRERVYAWRKLAEEKGATRDSIMDRWAVALEVIHSRGLTPSQVHSSFSDDGSVSLKFACDASVNELVEVDLSIAEAVVGRFQDSFSELITFSTVSS